MFSLEPTDSRANPVFRDAASFKQWVSQLQLTNLTLAQGTLRKQLDEFNRYALRGTDRLTTLEAMRESIAMVQTDFSKRLIGKKLPLSDDEFSTLIALTSLWQSLQNGYLRCLQEASAGDKSLHAKVPLLLHRGLYYSGLIINEFLRVGCEPDGKTWQLLHFLYASAAKLGVHNENVRDDIAYPGISTSCNTLYVKSLLLHRARLIGLSRSQWGQVDRWLCLWGDAYVISPQYSISKGDAPPLAIDLNGTRALQSLLHASTGDSMRYLPMVPLSKLIRVKTILLQQGDSPKKVELGEEQSSKDCIDLLQKLHACWCEHRHESLADELRDVPVTHLCTGLDTIYAHISGKPFKAPSKNPMADKDAQKQIETFGRVLDDSDRERLSQFGFLPEEWLVEDEGVLQARVLRKLSSGERIGQNQLVCVHNPDKSYKLGAATLVSVNRSSQLFLGIRYLPGIPQAVIARGKEGAGNTLSGTTPAMMLPEMANLRIPATLILPRDWFQSGRLLEITLADGQKQNVTLGISIEKGNDYERVSFKVKP